MADEERAFYYKALLIIVNQDTLAMVMIYEGWKDHLFDEMGVEGWFFLGRWGWRWWVSANSFKRVEPAREG